MKLLFLCGLFEFVRPPRLPLNPFRLSLRGPLLGPLLSLRGPRLDLSPRGLPLVDSPLCGLRPRSALLGALKSVLISTLSTLGSSFLSIFRDSFRVIALKLS